MGTLKKVGHTPTAETFSWKREFPDDPQKEILYRAKLKDVHYISVAPYEQAYFTKSGKIEQVILEGGIYEIDEEDRIDAAEVIWITKGEIKIDWGVPYFEKPGLMTKPPDSVSIGAVGQMRLQVVDAKTFIENLPPEPEVDLNERVRERITEVLKAGLREIFRMYEFSELLGASMNQISDLTRTTVSREFQKWGLELVMVTIANFAYPPEIQESMQKIVEQKSMTMARDIATRDVSSVKRSKIRQQVRKIEDRIDKLDNDLMDGNIEQEDYERQMDRLMAMKERYERQKEDELYEGRYDSYDEDEETTSDRMDALKKKEIPEPEIPLDTAPSPAPVSAPSPAPSPAPVSTPTIPPREFPLSDEEFVEVSRITKNAAIDYYDRMIPNRHYKLMVTLSDVEIKEKKARTKLLTGERSTQVQEELSIDLDEDTTVVVEPFFPGCHVVPPRKEVDFKESTSELEFFIAPLVQGKIEEARINFWYKNELAAVIETPTKVINPRVSMIIAAMGTSMSMGPKILALGLEITNLPKLMILGFSVDLLFLLGIIGFIISLIIAGIYYVKHKPKKTSREHLFKRDMLDERATGQTG